MRQTRLDESKKNIRKGEMEKSKDSAEAQATAGSKRKEPAADADPKLTKEEIQNRNKNRKTELSVTDDQNDEDSTTGQNGDQDGASSPVELSGDQRNVDSKLKGDDVEIKSGDSRDKKEVPWHVTEKGVVYFFYRPKVMSSDKAESNSTKSLDDVQSTSMLLVPRASESDTAPAVYAANDKGFAEDGQDDKRKPPNLTAYRLISLGKKRMPSPEAALKRGQEPGGIGGRHSEAIWATVADIGADLKAVADGMGEEHYSTKTRGEIENG